MESTPTASSGINFENHYGITYAKHDRKAVLALMDKIKTEIPDIRGRLYDDGFGVASVRNVDQLDTCSFVLVYLSENTEHDPNIPHYIQDLLQICCEKKIIQYILPIWSSETFEKSDKSKEFEDFHNRIGTLIHTNTEDEHEFQRLLTWLQGGRTMKPSIENLQLCSACGESKKENIRPSVQKIKQPTASAPGPVTRSSIQYCKPSALEDLRTGMLTHGPPITVKVTYVSPFEDKSSKRFSFVVTNEHATCTRMCSVFGKKAKDIAQMVNVSTILEMINYSVKGTDKKFIRDPIEIIIRDNTEINLLNDDSEFGSVRTFTPLSEAIKYPNSNTIHIQGKITHIKNPSTSKTNNINIQSFYLVDESELEVGVMLFKRSVEAFHYSTGECISLSFVRPQGEILQSTNSTEIKTCNLFPLTSYKQSPNKTWQIGSFSEIDQVPPKIKIDITKPVYIELKNPEQTFYMGCSDQLCKRKVDFHRLCRQHKDKSSQIYYCIQVFLCLSKTDKIKVTLFDQQMNSLTQITAGQMALLSPEKKNVQLNEILSGQFMVSIRKDVDYKVISITRCPKS